MLYFLLGFTTGVVVSQPHIVRSCIQFYQAAAAVAPDAPFKTMITIAWDQTLLRLEQYFRRSVVPVEGTDQWKVNYYIHGKHYAIHVRPLKGPASTIYTPEMRGKFSIVRDQ